MSLLLSHFCCLPCLLLQSVPRFIFFKAGQEIDNFATREKEKVAQAILKHAPAGVELGDWE
jgi:thioredoxin-like negative regulator of GroEL